MTQGPRGIIEHRRPGEWLTIRQIRGANRAAGQHWFDPDTLAFFNSRIHQRVYGGRFFVTSERDDYPNGAWDGERRYTVRRAEDDGTISTFGEFGQYPTAREAHSAARRAAEEEQA